MPNYDFLNEKTNEVKTLFFHMNDKKEYIDETGYKWLRLFNSPQASFDTNWNPDSSKDFVEKSARKSGTLGDLQNMAAELSQKRKDKRGHDEVAETYFKNYSKARRGIRHPLQQKRDNKIEIEL